ncbi:hypothetical protein MACH08_08690 [Oceanobacillus kimchii]|uniref:Uncharacterized protein n=1 Tax=Oceanobacillus kimchii TaxID=746691 RepID=A0ABQ5TGE7_9BACI|nr:hypothetical protein MACH08_08690 [Oceanobacillus kimchii]
MYNNNAVNLAQLLFERFVIFWWLVREVCGNIGLQFPDHELQQCVQICLYCAQESKS